MALAVFPWSGKYDCTESLTLTHINALTCILPVQQVSTDRLPSVSQWESCWVMWRGGRDPSQCRGDVKIALPSIPLFCLPPTAEFLHITQLIISGVWKGKHHYYYWFILMDLNNELNLMCLTLAHNSSCNVLMMTHQIMWLIEERRAITATGLTDAWQSCFEINVLKTIFRILKHQMI